MAPDSWSLNFTIAVLSEQPTQDNAMLVPLTMYPLHITGSSYDWDAGSKVFAALRAMYPGTPTFIFYRVRFSLLVLPREHSDIIFLGSRGRFKHNDWAEAKIGSSAFSGRDGGDSI